MKTDKRKLPLEELQKIAQDATKQALEGYMLPDSLRNELVIGVFIEGDDRVFQLYVPGDTPASAKVITRVTVNAVTGAVSPVKVFLRQKGSS